jgi:hypothetical protein
VLLILLFVHGDADPEGSGKMDLIPGLSDSANVKYKIWLYQHCCFRSLVAEWETAA